MITTLDSHYSCAISALSLKQHIVALILREKNSKCKTVIALLVSFFFKLISATKVLIPAVKLLAASKMKPLEK